MRSVVLGPTPESVVSAAAEIVREHTSDASLRGSLLAVVEGFRAAAFARTPPRLPPLVALPSLVQAAVTGEDTPSDRISGAVLLLFLGIDLLDDLMDGDITPYWQGATPAETLLVATTLTGAVAQLALAHSGFPAATVVAMEEAISRGGLRMAGGQRFDILARSRETVSPAEVEASVAAKSGAFTAMLAEFGALAAGAPPELVAEYAEWGHAYGTADQLRSDCADLFRDPVGSDITHGVVSYPLACLLESDEAGEDETRQLLRAAASDVASLAQLRRRLRESGALAATEVTVRWYNESARKALARAAPREPASSVLYALVGRLPSPLAASAVSAMPLSEVT
jgi:geranylgeranyl pyrophosphate synthase